MYICYTVYLFLYLHLDPNNCMIEEHVHVHVSFCYCVHVHTLCSCVGGRVYSWGSNRHGQLGHNAAVINISTPEVYTCIVLLPCSSKCVHIHCILQFSVLCTCISMYSVLNKMYVLGGGFFAGSTHTARGSR